MKRFMVPCDFGGRKAPFPIYVGEPKPDAHPLHNQSWWLSSERGGSIPQEVMDSFEKLHNIAKENNVSFEELCMYAMGEALGGSNNTPEATAQANKEQKQQAQQQPQQPQPTQVAAPEPQPEAQTGENAQERLNAQPQHDQDPNPN